MLETDSNGGRPESSLMLNLFESLCYWLETSGSDKLQTLEDLRMWMINEYMSIACSSTSCNADESAYQTAGNEVYSVKHLKRKLQKKYGDDIFFSALPGKRNIVCFTNTCSVIINDRWNKERLSETADENERIVSRAAKLIHDEIRGMNLDINCYPSKSDMASDATNCIPPLLLKFLQLIIPCKLKQGSLGQSIVQAARLHSFISPLLLGLALKLDIQHGSEELLMALARLGFSVSYDEVVRYKQSVVMAQVPGQSCARPYPEVFTQWVGDNVDHNIRTLDGKNTFHVMGLISISDSPQMVERTEQRIVSP